MKQVVIDFSGAGLQNGAVHFLKGIVLYGAIGAVTYAIQHVANFHPGTIYDGTIDVILAELLQASSKWLTTEKTVIDTSTEILG